MRASPVIPIHPLPSRRGLEDPGVGPAQALKGRGTAWAIPSRLERERREPVDDGWGPAEAAHGEPGAPLAGEAPQAAPVSGSLRRPQTEVREERVQRILSGNDSPDIGFDLSVNPYRGCEHGCIYCYARPTHGWLDRSPGLDFETRLVAKVNAAERLQAALSQPGYAPMRLNVGSVTDAYQPVERRLGITRSVLEVLHAHRHPFSVVTKSALVERDLDLIAPMAAQGRAAVHVSLTTLDPSLARILEPRAASPSRRLETVRRLADAGVPVGVSLSPIIPFINEPEIERLVEAAAQAGATHAFSIVLRLPWEVAPLFQDWLQTHFPERASRVMARVREMRGGRDNDARFGSRMTGQGVWAQLVRQRFRKAAARHGLGLTAPELDCSGFRVPEGLHPGGGAPHQMTLF